ncbi:MAG: hypothetical protein ACLFRG_21900 [Desulfococcaceae bacterium]
MNLHQMNAGYEAEADRILFRFNTREGQVFSFHLTRRFVRLLWPVLTDLLKTDLRRRAPENAHAAEALLDFEREKTLAGTDFRTPFAAGDASHPLGKGPVLLSRIQVKEAAGGGRLLCLLPSRGAGVTLPAHPRFLHTFAQLIREASGRAQWDLRLSETGRAPAGPSPDARLH